MDKIDITVEDIRYQISNLHEDQRPLMNAVNIMLAVMSTVAVALRVSSRRLMKARLMADDYAIIMGLLFGYGLLTTVYIGTRHGLGQHAIGAGWDNLRIVIRVFYAFQIVYALTTITVKTAVLLMYRRLFPTPRFKLAVKLVFLFNFACFFSTTLVFIFQCRQPISNGWTNPNDPKCINHRPFFTFGGVLSLVTDVMILAMPMFVVWKLHTSLRRKIALTSIFLLGGFVCMAAVARLPQFKDKAFLTDPTWRSAPAMIWSNIEACVGIICACLPTYRPLVRVAIAEPIQSIVRKRRSRRSAEHSSSEPKSPASPFSPATMKFPWRNSGSLVSSQSPSPSSLAMSPSVRSSSSPLYEANALPPHHHHHHPPHRPDTAHTRPASDVKETPFVLHTIRPVSAIEWPDMEKQG